MGDSFNPPILQRSNPAPFSTAPDKAKNIVAEDVNFDDTTVYSVNKAPGNKINVILVGKDLGPTGGNIKIYVTPYFMGNVIGAPSTMTMVPTNLVSVLSTILILSDEIRIQFSNTSLTSGTITILTSEHYA